MQGYQPQEIEKKWQDFWDGKGLNKAEDLGKKPKFYCLDMFPYPSGAGLHVGHPKGYTATDIICRYKRMQGFNVMHPMGWDAFGLPAENYAIKTKIHPDKSTHQNIERFREQIKSLGFSYDWTREVDTSNPEYYKWTQWFFLFLYKQGLAYKAKAPVNWCPKCQTVLANEQAQNGRCDRCNSEVAQKDLEQWFFKITDFSDDLLAGLGKIDWPEPIKTMQRNWIGKSEGWEIKFKVQSSPKESPYGDPTGQAKFKVDLEVFTTRIDTIFGCTYLVVAPEHEIITNYQLSITNYQKVKEYVEKAKMKSELERQAETKDKTGVKLEGIMAINPANGQEIPIFVADYVLGSYGTGAIMAVPAHDKRDKDFAFSFLPFIPVILPQTKGEKALFTSEAEYMHRADMSVEEKMDCEIRNFLSGSQRCYSGEGILVNSGQFDGMRSEEAREEIGQWLAKNSLAQKKVNYKLRDWLVSRQRYWGAPIPIIYCDKCGQVPVSESDLPVLLPTDVDFMPSGESPLVKSREFHNVKCPKCGAKARRESDTMDTFVCSSWYFFRYTDPQNEKEFAGKKLIDYWCPVDWYVGGAEHAVLHLLYARFFAKALFKAGLIGFDEPFLKLRNVGLILAEGGEKMSKSKGNVINPDDVIAEYGADTLRCYEMFMGPFEQAIAWDTKGVRGVYRFLQKIYKLNFQFSIFNSQTNPKSQIPNPKLEKLLHKTIKKVGEDIEAMKFNTAISALMILVNALEQEEEISGGIFQKFLLILAPFAPHLAEEMWQGLGNKGSIFLQNWPQYDKKLVQDEKVNLIVQVNGRVRGSIEIDRGIEQNQAEEIARGDAKINNWLKDKQIKKVIFVKNKLINFVVDFQ